MVVGEVEAVPGDGLFIMDGPGVVPEAIVRMRTTVRMRT